MQFLILIKSSADWEGKELVLFSREMIFLHGFKSFWPNSCCKLFIYLLGKRKIYVGHQDPTERFFLARNDN